MPIAGAPRRTGPFSAGKECADDDPHRRSSRLVGAVSLTVAVAVFVVAAAVMILVEWWMAAEWSNRPPSGAPRIQHGSSGTSELEFDDLLQPYPSYLQTRLDSVDEHAALEQMHDAVDTFLARHPRVPEPVRTHLAIAVAEVGANILEHSGRSGPIHILMTLHLLADQVRIDFTDNGRPGEVDLANAQMPDVLSDRGRGLAIAQAVLRRMYHHADSHGNRWTLLSHRFAYA